MDLLSYVHELQIRKEMIERAIVELSQLQVGSGPSGTPGERRGRKSMGLEERREVSERMKRYWANRRRQLDHGTVAAMGAVDSMR